MNFRYRDLFLTYLKIGLFTFGGGYAMIPLMKRELVDNRKWITEDDILDIFAVSETTPGPVAINSATFIGYKLKGFWGAFTATFGIVLPSFVIIVLISLIFDAFMSNRIIQYAFWGIRAGVLALIFNAFIMMFKKCPRHWLAYTIAAAAFILVAFLHINAIIVIIGSALLGLSTLFFTIEEKKK